MLLPIKPICPINKIRRDGTSPIFLQYCFSKKQRTLLNTGIAIPPSFWSPKQLIISEQLPVEYGGPVELNEELFRLRRIAEDLVYHATKQQIKDRVAWVKANFSPSLDLGDIGDLLCKTPHAASLYEQIDTYPFLGKVLHKIFSPLAKRGMKVAYSIFSSIKTLQVRHSWRVSYGVQMANPADQNQMIIMQKGTY